MLHYVEQDYRPYEVKGKKSKLPVEGLVDVSVDAETVLCDFVAKVIYFACFYLVQHEDEEAVASWGKILKPADI